MTSPDSFEPKWTSGPWQVYNGNVWAGGDPEVEGDPLIHTHRQRGGFGTTDWAHGQPRVTRRADAELIALAPELAAAVLAHARWNDDWETPGSDDAFDAACVELNRLADRLRMIGADDE